MKNFMINIISNVIKELVGKRRYLSLNNPDYNLLCNNLNEVLYSYKNIEYGADLNPIDAFFAYRLLLGRNPSLTNELQFLLSNKSSTWREFLHNLLESEEFSNTPGFLPPNKVLMAETEGFRFWFNSSDQEMGVRMALGLYELSSVELMKQIIQPGMVCIDAGANTGFYTCLMASRKAVVYAFEPMPKNYEFLLRNINENNFQKSVQLYQFACSDEEKIITGSMVSNMYVTTEVDEGDKVTMEAVAVDNIVKSPVNLIKLDIEGHEPQAIQGMQNLISLNKPIIFSEINEYWLRKCSGLGAKNYLQILKNLGYEVFNVNDLKNPIQVENFNIDLLETVDIVAFHIDS